MITYKKCTEVDIELVYQAFKIGFSDYIIRLDVSQEMFIKRFFGPEGNALEYSFVAIDQEQPVGVILGGIKEYERIKTLRCGALCIHPDYRGKGVSQALFELHRELGMSNQCKQLFLEVIVGNDRAIRFYQKLGYEKRYDISYFSHKTPGEMTMKLNPPYVIRPIDMDILRTLQPQIEDIHINWQNDFDYMELLEEVLHYGVYNESELLGALSINKNGKVFFLWIAPLHRSKGLGKALLGYAAQTFTPSKIMINYTNNTKLEGFIKHIGFERDAISQYEMYLTC